jgi:hypothetical protein
MVYSPKITANADQYEFVFERYGRSPEVIKLERERNPYYIPFAGDPLFFKVEKNDLYVKRNDRGRVHYELLKKDFTSRGLEGIVKGGLK